MGKYKQYEEKIFIENLSIYPREAYGYSRCLNPNRSGRGEKNSLKNLNKPKLGGLISDKVRNRIRRSIEFMVLNAEWKNLYDDKSKNWYQFKIAFITLTLPVNQFHEDKEITARCLSNFIDIIKKSCGVQNYVWRAETQKNGNIHYHITVDNFIHYKRIRNIWNKSLSKLGYLDEFFKLHGHFDAPTENVKAVWKVKDLAAYLSAYVTKKEKNRLVTGRKWGCSEFISKYRGRRTEQWDDEYNELKNIVESTAKYRKDLDYTSCFYGDFSRIVIPPKERNNDLNLM